MRRQVITLVLGVLFASTVPAQTDRDAAVAHALDGDQVHVTIAGERLWSTPLLREMRRDGLGLPTWRTSALRDLQAALQDSALDGLAPEDFLASRVATLEREPAALRDLLATEALARLAFALRYGRTNPQVLVPDWDFSGTAATVTPVTWLRETAASDDIRARVRALRPGMADYAVLLESLRAHRAIAAGGGWAEVPPGDTLKPAVRDERVAILRERLTVSGEYQSVGPVLDPTVYDDGLQQAVRIFQRRHGLTPDGAVGRQTLAALNVTPAARMTQIAVNLERLRWVFRGVEDTYVAVNIAAFDAVYVERGETRWRGRAIVGKPFRQTPIFRDHLRYIELNPTWTVPPTILREDILPQLRRNPGYLAARRLDVLDRDGRRIDVSRIAWRDLDAGHFPYVLRQQAGPDNALGRIKFMFPNVHAVYLHDTPARELFARDERAFSSGCIRIEHPLALAEQLLRDPQQWNHDALAAAIASGATRRVDLPVKVPVLLLYLTAFRGADGAAHFVRDIYTRDADVAASLQGVLDWQPSRDFPQPTDRLRTTTQ